MTTRPDSGECIEQEKTSISRDEFAEDSLKIVSLPPVENDHSVEEMLSPKKQVKSSPFTSVSEKDGEIIYSDSIEVSFSETSSLFFKETEAMNVECPGVVSVPETGSTFLEENKVGEELQQIKEISEISTEGDQFGDDVHKIEEVVETDGCVVSISEIQGLDQESFVPRKENLDSEKKGQDSDVQRLLEAENRRLLAEIEVGTIFRKKDDVDTLARASDIHIIEKNGNSSKEQHEKVERMRVKDNAFVARSVMTELVNDTALVDVVPFYKKGNDHPKRPGTAHTDKDAPRKHKKIGEEKPNDEKQDKGNASNVVERNTSTKVSDFRNRGETNGKQLRIMYSRNQMVSMRYAHIVNQKKLWSDVYARLLPKLVAEYEGLVNVKSQKTSKSNPRESGVSILGNVDHSLENLEDPFYGSSDEDSSEARVLDNENKLRRVKFHTAGYRNGIVAGKEAIAQEGYNFGYKESVLAGYKFGMVRGVSSALAFIPDGLREKLIDEQETREKFLKLRSSVHALSTEVAMKRFYETLTTKQGEEKSGEEGSESGSGSGVNATTDLGSYVTELSSLIDKSPKVEIKLDK